MLFSSSNQARLWLFIDLEFYSRLCYFQSLVVGIRREGAYIIAVTVLSGYLSMLFNKPATHLALLL